MHTDSRRRHAPPTDESVPVCDVKELLDADGIMFGIATRYGAANAQLKSLWDSTGSLWQVR
jgi:NAD(P)H dehydrogenase (quinone)